MDAMARMDLSVEAVVHDLETVLSRVRQLKQEISLMEQKGRTDEQLTTMKEVVADIQARTEGIEAFVQACQKRARRDELPAEDIDIWM